MPAPQPETWTTVLLAARTGAAWAFERIWQELSPVVAGYLRSQGAAEPDDLTSEVFIGVFKGLPTFEGDWGPFRSWVFTIAHRRLTDERRARGRRPEPADELHLPPAADSAEDATDRLRTAEVQVLCEALVPDQRDVLLLRIVAGLTIDEIAEALGKTTGAVKQLQRRGLVALRKEMQPEGVPL